MVGGLGATDMYWIEGKDAVKHPTVHETIPHCKEWSCPNVIMPWLRNLALGNISQIWWGWGGAIAWKYRIRKEIYWCIYFSRTFNPVFLILAILLTQLQKYTVLPSWRLWCKSILSPAFSTIGLGFKVVSGMLNLIHLFSGFQNFVAFVSYCFPYHLWALILLLQFW